MVKIKRIYYFIFFIFIIILILSSLILGNKIKYIIKQKHQTVKEQEAKKGKNKDQISQYLGVIDSVGLYQKNGRIESYGLEIHQIPYGPIKISTTELNITDEFSALVWFPDRVTINSFSSLYLKMSNKNPGSDNNIFIGIHTNKGILVFGKPGKKINLKSLKLELPDDIKEYLSGTIKILKRNGNKEGEYLTQSLCHSYQEDENQCLDPLEVKSVFILTQGMKGKNINIDNFSITPNHKFVISKRENTILRGKVVGAKIPVGDYVYLRTEDNKTYKTQLNLEGHFVFPNIKLGSIISIFYPYKEMDYYSNLGRWFEVVLDYGTLIINLTPEFLNITGAEVDPKSYKFISKKQVSPQDNDYEPHVRMAWHGLNIIQCYESFPFTNNLGYLDRDRRIENPSKCLRILHAGGSSAAALQVKTNEKYNILLEQELGVRLNKCVEVISISRDNGDIGTHNKRLKYFIENFKPDLVLIENLSGLMMQMHPILLQRLLGYDFEHNIFPHFYYDTNGELKFSDMDPDFAFFMHQKNINPLKDDVPLVSSLSVPYDNMDPIAKETWKYLGDIFFHYKKEYPNQNFALHTGIDLAQCKYPCKPVATSKNYFYGPQIFIKNHKEYCQKEGITCFDPVITENHNRSDTLLTFTYDGHYSPRGHQWLAKELGRLLENYFRKDE